MENMEAFKWRADVSKYKSLKDELTLKLQRAENLVAKYSSTQQDVEELKVFLGKQKQEQLENERRK